VEGEEVRISATAGIAMYPADGMNAETVFANAEAALHRAKATSAPFLFYGREMNARVSESLRLETRLRRAIENDQLMLWYQPKIDLATRQLTGFEALMRWEDPESGLVPPAVFIPVMEQTGLILDAGAWALSQVARDCARCIEGRATATRIAVNVSPVQLRQPDFVVGVLAAAAELERAGGRLDLEITESMVMEDITATVRMLRELGEHGLQVAVDDFGTGYSSLAYIARLPVHALKIDRSFVVGMTQNEHSLAIVRSIISLARSLGLRVIAEGVETEAQAGLLQRLECDEMQGYLVSRPLPPGAMVEFLARWAED
jgi:EAL domain-containing protein (putative c-di-GMP-specific phosphodiesterase class I)